MVKDLFDMADRYASQEEAAAAKRSRPSRPPRTDDFVKVTESTCPFHPKGKHSAKDCYSLKDYMEKHSKGPSHDQDGPDRNPGHQAGGPAFPDPKHQLNMILRGSDAYESKQKQKLISREINAITTATPKYLK